ncbi:MAG TPA: ABC transporter permease, partial [Polyangiaceae bacterium]|nr:ABC transporter permease [Polyangiaceae bacterium]
MSSQVSGKLSDKRAYRPLLELCKARLREFWREPGYVFWVFGFPLIMAIGLGLAFRNRAPDPPRVAIVFGADRAWTDALLKSKRVRAENMPRAAADRALGRAKVDLVVDQGPGAPEFRFEPTQERGQLARAIVNDVVQQAAGRRDPLAVRELAVTAHGSRYIDFLMPGLLGMNLIGSSMWGVGYNLIVARKRHLLRRYAVTPMRRSHFLLAYFYSRSVFLALELALLVLFGRLAFGTVIQGSIASLVVVAGLGAASFAGLSLLIGARLDNTEVANGWMNLVQLPMWILSGSFFSYERFPEWLRIPIRLLPL